MMLDADHFKAFNDRHGHQRGDEVLRTIAACLQRTTRRPGDLPTRYGGEEFAVVLPEHRRGRRSQAGGTHPEPPSRPSTSATPTARIGRVTVSVGVGTLSPLVGWDSALLLRVADAALYGAKRQGRNRVAGGDDPSEDGRRGPRPDPSFAV